MKFKTGDRVRVRKLEDMPETNEREFFTQYMGKFCNLPAKVHAVVSSNEIYLHFDGDTFPEQYRFAEWMLEIKN